MHDRLEAIAAKLANVPQVIIAGGPRSGKTSLALVMGERGGRAVHHADSLIGSYEWSDASAEVATWFDRPGAWIVEGVCVPRALRKWLPTEKLFTGVVVYLPHAIQQRSPGQETMAAGVDTVWSAILPELERRGIVAMVG